jgi:ABC-2 type transport system permease protein
MALLLGARLRRLRNAVLAIGSRSTLRVVVVTFVGVFLWTGLFGGFLASIKFADRALADPVDLADLTSLLLGLFFMSLMLLLTFSNAVISFGSLYRSPETAYLMAQPLTPGTLYLYRMLESLAFASWASAALGLPLLLAYGIGLHVGPLYYAVIPAYLVPFVVIPAAAGAAISMLLTLLFPRNRAKVLGVAFAAALGIAAIAGLRAYAVRRGNIPFSTIWAQKVLGQFQFVRSPFLPSYWATKGLVAAGRGEAGEALYFLLLLSVTAFFLVMLGQFLAVRLYVRSWDATMSNVRRTRYPPRRWTDALVARLRRSLGSWPVFIHKDVRTFVRDPAQWAQAVIFFGLLGVYIANIRNLNYNLESPFYLNLIATLNMLAVGLTLSTMTTRFVFPLVSLEGRSFWVLGLLPVPRWKILAAKLAFASIGSVLVTEALVLLSNHVLGTEPTIVATQAVLGAALAVGLSGIAVGMGAIFPDFKSRTPSEIVSGFGGTLTLVASLAFVLAIVIPESVIRHRYLVRNLLAPEEYQGIMIKVLAAGGVLAAACVAGPMLLGARALNRQEF